MREAAVDRVSAPPFRLPDTISPRFYDIEIEPDLENGTFRGKVVIQLDILKPTRHIILHAVRLKVTEARVQLQDGIFLYPKVQYNADQEAIYADFGFKLIAGTEATLSLDYNGQISPAGSMAGLYATPYQIPGQGVKLGFETHFEPTMARLVFPCFDEPALKAEFAVALVVPSDLTCLSNMEVASEKSFQSLRGTSRKWVSFKRSPKMSTYLVVMIAGYFNVLETNDFHVPIRVWAALDKDINSAAHALVIAVKAMKAHERNFNLKYPLSKLDMVAIPGHQGGMEHWGCVSYQESGLILPPRPSEADKIGLAYLIAHELAHQWFGNIVTMQFWDSLWLNEAFSEWAAIHAVSQIVPEHNAWANFIASPPLGTRRQGLQAALELDSNIGSHAIQAPNLPASSAFDSITYLKGCSIIRMMAEDLGLDVFLHGISTYLKRFIYSNATTEQLWEVLSEVSGRDVSGFVSAWTTTVGYPLLTVNELRPTGEIVVSQSRFLQNGDSDNEVGPYPVTILLKEPEGTTLHTLTGHSITIPTNIFKYKLNAGQSGFYRVSYPLSRLHKFGVQFAGDYLSVEDKVGIVADLGAEVLSGSTSRNARVTDFLDFVLRVKDHVDSLYVWREILAQLGRLRVAFLFDGNRIQDILKFVRYELLARFIERGIPQIDTSASSEQILWKALLFSQLQDHPLVQNVSKTAWSKLLSGDKDALDPNIKKWVFNVVLSLDKTDDTWTKLKSITFNGTYIHSGDPVTPGEAFASLGSATDPLLIARSLQLITPGSSFMATKYRVQKSGTSFVLNTAARLNLLQELAKHRPGAEAAWAWLRETWNDLQEDRKNNSIQGYGFLSSCLAGLATSTHLDEVQEFFADKQDEGFKIILKQAVDNIRSRARFAEADRDELLKWATERGL